MKKKTKPLFAILSVSCIGIGGCLASSVKPRQITAPLAFEANAGSPAFLCRGDGFQATLLPERLVLRANVPEGPDVVVKFVGANALARGIASDPLPGRSNYLIGADPGRWRTNVLNYARVEFAAVYPGIAVTYYGSQRRLEHDFIVSPGADARRIRLALSGALPERISRNGDLLLNWQGREIRWPRPTVYQEIDGVRRKIPGNYVRRGRNEVGFSIGSYDRSKPLVIDPVLTLSFSTYFGGSSYEWGAVALGPDGSPYLAGGTGSANFPTLNPEQAKLQGNNNVFIAKFSIDGSKLIYSTFIGGSGTDYGWAVAVDATGAVYVTGQTTSPDFPKINAFQTQFTANGQYTFVVKLDPTGSKLLYSSPFGGGGEVGWALAVDSAGNAYVAGGAISPDFPIVGGLPYKFVPNFLHGFVSKLAPAGDHLVFSTFLGGSGNDLPKGLALDTSGNTYIVGGTSSSDFPVKNPYQSTNNSQDPNEQQTAFVTKLDPSGANLVYSTFLGGSVTEIALGIALDAVGNAYVTGSTASGDFPTLNAYQPFKSGDLIQTNPS